jgi:flagellar basal-body rod protein FlgC
MSGLERLFSGMRASATGLSAERLRIDVIARNIANAHSTSTPEGGPYTRKVVKFAPLLDRSMARGATPLGVRVAGVVDDRSTPYEVVHDPGHPDADADGNVTMPNVDPTMEMADLIMAMRAYESNLTAQENFVRMAERALRLLQ